MIMKKFHVCEPIEKLRWRKREREEIKKSEQERYCSSMFATEKDQFTGSSQHGTLAWLSQIELFVADTPVNP